jgi:activator of Hsp90 ATPase-like protein
VFIVGRVIDVDPPKRLAHTQRVTTRSDPWTLVTWELEEVAGGTRVTLRHTGWPADTKGLDKVDGTWAMILPELKRLLETGEISTGLKARYAAYRALMWAMPARTRTENVPPPD